MPSESGNGQGAGKRLAPFLSFYGSKWRAAPKYPAPKHKRIVEPFAGGAGYSILHYQHDVVLVEKDPKIAAVWRFLIGAKSQDILDLPLLEPGQHIEETGLEGARRWLVGFSLNQAVKQPCNMMRGGWFLTNGHTAGFWNQKRRARLAAQVEKVSHWQIIEGDYTQAPQCDATWFIDPPYNNRAGEHYKHGRKGLDYEKLAGWARDRPGQVIVCEQEGATWLPFRPFAKIKAGRKIWSKEAIWTNED